MILKRKASEARGVTVYTETMVDGYPSADWWEIDDRGSLHLYTPTGRGVATYVVATWFRVVVGIQPKPPQ